jgi:hypothetical protein
VPAGLFVAHLVQILMMVVGKVRDIEEGIAFQPQVDECRLHTGEHAGDPAFVNAAGEGILVGALEENLYEDIVLKNGHLCFVAVGRND